MGPNPTNLLSMCLTSDTWAVVLNSMELVRCLKLSRWLSALFGWPCRAPSPRSPFANSLCRATSRPVLLLHSGGRHWSWEVPAAHDPPQSFRRISLFSVTNFNIMYAFMHGTFWPRGVCNLSDIDMGQGGEEPKQVKQERWYKDSHTGLILEGHAASSTVLCWFQRPSSAQSLPGCIQHLAGSQSGLIYVFIYLAYLFQLPIFFALLLRGGKMTHPHQVLSASLPAPVSTHYTQTKKALFQLLETKETNQAPCALFPEAEGGHWYGSTTPSQISPGCFHLPENWAVAAAALGHQRTRTYQGS